MGSGGLPESGVRGGPLGRGHWGRLGRGVAHPGDGPVAQADHRQDLDPYVVLVPAGRGHLAAFCSALCQRPLCLLLSGNSANRH